MLRPLCKKCGVRPVCPRYDPSRKKNPWQSDCYRCHGNVRNPQALKAKGPICESCGFVPKDSCQLDVDHKDGNHDNWDKSNLQTLCANCHRLKTKLNGDGVYKKADGAI